MRLGCSLFSQVGQVGKPGSGKSTALKRLLWEEAGQCEQAIQAKQEKVPPIPIFLELRDLRGSAQELIKKPLQRDKLRLERFLGCCCTIA